MFTIQFPFKLDIICITSLKLKNYDLLCFYENGTFYICRHLNLFEMISFKLNNCILIYNKTWRLINKKLVVI